MREIKNISINGKEVRSLAWGGIIYSKSMDYEELEYIQGDGNQAIDTGYTLRYGDKYRMVFMWDSLFSLENKLLGACGGTIWSNPPDNVGFPRHGYYNGSVSAFINSREVQVNPVIPKADSINRWFDSTFELVSGGELRLTDLATKEVYIGIVPNIATDWVSGSDAMLFRNASNLNINKAAGKIALLEIYSADTLVADLHPVVRKADNAVGMWDTVRGVFLENVGTGAFVAGAPTGRYY